MFHFGLDFLLAEISMTSHLYSIGIFDEEGISNGCITVLKFSCGKFVYLAEPIGKAEFEPKAAWVIMEIFDPAFELAFVKENAIVKARGEERCFLRAVTRCT